jgi:hypothetical protein
MIRTSFAATFIAAEAFSAATAASAQPTSLQVATVAATPQGQATGYPIYRLEWQAPGSLARRIRNCMTGVRAEPLVAGSVEMVELELHLASRAMGMAVETPAVRP